MQFFFFEVNVSREELNVFWKRAQYVGHCGAYKLECVTLKKIVRQ